MGLLVGIHGIAKHQLGRHQLLTAWKPALGDGLERACGHPVPLPEVDLAFYGDVYLGGGDRSPSVDAATLPADAPAEMDDAECGDVGEELAAVVTDADVAAAEAEVEKGYTRSPRSVQVLLRAVDRRFGAAAGLLHLGVMRQVRRYLTDPELKARVDARVEEAVGTQCRVLIGHSLGSVVAYEYLRRREDHGVELLVTLGSPLGLRMVRDRLPAVEALPNISWVNVRDLRDPVACAGRLASWWPQLGENGDVVVNNGGDAHAVERYLSREATGRVLLAALPQLVNR